MSRTCCLRSSPWKNSTSSGWRRYSVQDGTGASGSRCARSQASSDVRQLLERAEDLALPSGERRGQRPRGAGVEVCLAFLGRGGRDGAPDPYLAAQDRPVEGEGGIGAVGELAPFRLVTWVAKDQPSASAPCSITIRTSGRPAASDVARDRVCGSVWPAATASANQAVNRGRGRRGRRRGRRGPAR